MRSLAPREAVEVARNRQLCVSSEFRRSGRLDILARPLGARPASGRDAVIPQADLGGRWGRPMGGGGRARTDPGPPVNLERARLVGRTVGGLIGQEARRALTRPGRASAAPERTRQRAVAIREAMEQLGPLYIKI